MSDAPRDFSLDLDEMCREALARRRLDAFDDVDVQSLLAAPTIDRATALWIGRRLMLNGRALNAYRAGQAILARASEREAADRAP